MKIAQPYRSPGEYQAYLKGVTAVAEAFGFSVDAKSWGGGIPTELDLEDALKGAPQDVYDQETANAEIPDAAAQPDSEGPSSNSEPGPSA